MPKHISDEPEEVTVLGKKIRSCRNQDEGNIVWGVIIVTAGIILLGNNFGIIGWGFWAAISFMWPVLFIVIGIQVIVGHSVFGRIITTVISLALISFVILFGLRATQWPYLPSLPPIINQLLTLLEQSYGSIPNRVWLNFDRAGY